MLGEFLKEERYKYGSTLTSVAEKVGVTQPFMSNVEKGKKFPTVSMFFSIVKGIASLSSQSVDAYQDILNNFLKTISPSFPIISPNSNRAYDVEELRSILLTDLEHSNYFILNEREKTSVVGIIESLLTLIDTNTGIIKDYEAETLDNESDGKYNINKKLSLNVEHQLDLNFIEAKNLLKYMDLRIDGKKLNKTDIAVLETVILGIRNRRSI